MKRTSCITSPDAPNGEPSRLYNDLNKRVGDRKKANWIYSVYSTSNTAQKMEQAVDGNGKKLYYKNSQGEFNAEDVIKFTNYRSLEREMKDLHSEAQKYDAEDISGKLIDYTNAKEALDKANTFNDNHNGLVATVIQHGNIYNIYVSEKNARTHMQPTEVKEKLSAWDTIKQAFNSINVDIEDFPEELKSTFNANNPDVVRHLINLQKMSFRWLSAHDALILFKMDSNSPQVQRLVGSFGSIENAAQAVEGLRNGLNLAPQQISLLMRAVEHCQGFQGLNLNNLQDQVSQIMTDVRTHSSEYDISQTLHKLKKKYNIDIEEINLIGKKIETLSQAAGEAALQIKRKIRELEKDVSKNKEGKRLEKMLSQLLLEVQCKKYYSGMLNFLKEAKDGQSIVEDLLKKVPQSGTELQKLYERAKTLMDIKQIREQYYPVIDALTKETLKIDESINQIDIDNMRNIARELKDFFDKQDDVVNRMAEEVMEGLLMELVGDEAPDGQSIANIIKIQKDTSIIDYLYSIGRSSNTVISAMGKVIRDAQDSRNPKLNEIAKRIRRATEKYHKAGGKNTEFIYEEDEEHLVSDIDWKSYNDALNIERKSLARQGLKGYDFKIALNVWEEDNTEDRVVDVKTGRTERVPNKKYRKNNGMIWNETTNQMDFVNSNFTPAQQIFYNDLMSLKGEIGSLLPANVQQQYLAPQVRRNMLDALNKAKNASDVLKALKDKMENIYKVREDDTNYAEKGVINGEEYTYAYGTFDNRRLKEIPIFYVNKVEQGELLKDFSTGLQHLASTAVNYEAMSNVQQVVEFIGDFAKAIAARDDKNEADVVQNQFLRVSKGLYAWGQNTNTSDLIDGYISQHLFGEKRDSRESKGWQKFVDSIISYTSFKGLATNVKGALSNYLVGEFQMLVEAGCGEFYGLKDYLWAHLKLFGNAGVGGELKEAITNNMNSKATLFREMFDPINENFSDKSHQRYHNSWFRQLVGHDCSFIGYATGEYLIHYVNMYAILNKEKVKLNGKIISLYDAFEVGNKQDDNSELVIKQGVTKLDGTVIDQEYLENVRKKIRYANQTCHGSMNEEDKGLIHRRMMGRLAMNFRQWMVEHYSRRFRKTHFDALLGENREGYWYSLYRAFRDSKGGDAWRDKDYATALGLFAKDYIKFMLRSQSQWTNLDEMQKNNIKRVHTEMMMYLALCGLSMVLGEPDKHKKEFWRRWWIYQVRRLMLDTEASMPHPKAISSALTILQSPMAGVNTINSLLYTFAYGPFNGDLFGENNTIKSGDYKGWNRYIRNTMKYTMPFFKDWEQLQKMDEDEAVFQIFKDTPSNR